MNYTELIDYIQSLHSKFQYFHLQKCPACSAPSYCEPCRICTFYNPYDEYRTLEEELNRCRGSKESIKKFFIRSVNDHNNISAWYISGFFNTCLFKPIPFVTKLTIESYQLKHEIETLYQEQKQMTVFPSAEQIWKWVVEENKYEEYVKLKYG